jgi:hypothetical protein
MHHLNELGLPVETHVLAEECQPSNRSYGDALVAMVRTVRYRCKPELEDHESVDEWLARGGKIIQC